jgi:hypothetical protein
LLDHHWIALRSYFNAASLSVAFQVPSVTSLPSLPGTVMTIALVGMFEMAMATRRSHFDPPTFFK